MKQTEDENGAFTLEMIGIGISIGLALSLILKCCYDRWCRGSEINESTPLISDTADRVGPFYRSSVSSLLSIHVTPTHDITNQPTHTAIQDGNGESILKLSAELQATNERLAKLEGNTRQAVGGLFKYVGEINKDQVETFAGLQDPDGQSSLLQDLRAVAHNQAATFAREIPFDLAELSQLAGVESTTETPL